MIQAFLDPNTYTFAGGFAVGKGKDLVLPESIARSQTMLVKWQIRNLAKGVTIDQIAPAALSAVLEIPGLGQIEDDEYQIKPSIQGQDRVQLISLDPVLPYKITLSQIDPFVTNSVLEIYTTDIEMGDFNNPSQVTTDFSPVIAAIGASSAATVAATAATMRKVTSETESSYTARFWTNTPANHVAVAPDPARIGGSFYNTGNKAVAVDKFADISTKTAEPQADGLIQPGGTYNFKSEEAGMGYLLYTLGSTTTSTVAINLQK